MNGNSAPLSPFTVKLERTRPREAPQSFTLYSIIIYTHFGWIYESIKAES